MSKDASAPPVDPADVPSIQERVRQALPDFTEAEGRVAHALLGDYPVAGLETVAKLARRAGTSGPTILRFVGRLGFASYAAFQEALRSEIHTRLQGPLSRYSSLRRDDEADLTRQVSEALRRNIEGAARNTSPEDLAAIVDQLCDPGRNAFFLGGRFSWMLASYFHHYLRELRPGARIIRDSSAAWADYLLDVRAGDVLVVFDFRRYQNDVLEFARGASAQGASVVLVTDVWYSPIAAFADYAIACPVGIPSAFDSGVSGLAIVEMLVAGVVEKLGETAKDRIAALETLRKTYNLGD
ncbi:MurR/RpiR family transcriptional regulator [Aurantimonas sp. VKM B-3413]|uniref:MurR/RpiR family transcriptional regulator n=1 Tax=Aurantimonas sp. VKM B-3413 TaxID=2779401 RepID=UPI001E4C475C|nr:MurR/RpiR family transcriptional regulator [Aurantimonas sp. VKM B-3413]